MHPGQNVAHIRAEKKNLTRFFECSLVNFLDIDFDSATFGLCVSCALTINRNGFVIVEVGAARLSFEGIEGACGPSQTPKTGSQNKEFLASFRGSLNVAEKI